MPSGDVSEAVAGLRAMIARCSAFRAMVGAEGEDEEAIQAAALARVHVQEAAKDSERPLAIVCLGEDMGSWETKATGLTTSSGDLILAVEYAPEGGVPEPVTSDVLYGFTDAVGAMMRELVDAGEEQELRIRRIQGVNCGVADEDRGGTGFFFGVWRVMWGWD